MTLGLRPGISFCEVEGRYLFLDLWADRYFGLADAAERAFRSLVGSAAEHDEHTIQQLHMSGLLIETADQHPLPCPPVPMPTASLLDADHLRSSFAERASAFTALIRTKSRLKRRGLGTAIDRLRCRKVGIAPIAAPHNRICELAAAFDTTARLMRSHDQCLVRSIAIADCLASRTISADLVIAVRIRPFAAHCWVQIGSRLVNDQQDQVASYTPILVV